MLPVDNDIGCEAHLNVKAPCCPICLMDEIKQLRLTIRHAQTALEQDLYGEAWLALKNAAENGDR